MKAMIVGVMLLSSSAWAGEKIKANQAPSTSVGETKSIQVKSKSKQVGTSQGAQTFRGSLSTQATGAGKRR